MPTSAAAALFGLLWLITATTQVSSDARFRHANAQEGWSAETSGSMLSEAVAQQLWSDLDADELRRYSQTTPERAAVLALRTSRADALDLSPETSNAAGLDDPALPSQEEPADISDDSRDDASGQTPATDASDPEIPTPAVRRSLPPELEALGEQIRECLEFYRRRPLNSRDDSGWAVMHSFLGTGPHTLLRIGGPDGRTVNAVGWMCWNRPCAGGQLFYLQGNRIHGRIGPGYQGHPAQFLAMLAQLGVTREYELQIDGRKFTVADLVQSEMLNVRAHEEQTFRLISFAHYLPSDVRWTNDVGESWDLPKLIRTELSQPINGAPCGGTHRLMALSMAVHKRIQRGQPVDGQWQRAQKYIRDYHRYTLSLQNPDGSFSSDWFRGRASWGGIDRQIQTTGHILEWLVFSLPGDELTDPRVVRSVQFVSLLLVQHRHRDWEIGPRSHALRALSVYEQRAFHGTDPEDQQLARETHYSRAAGAPELGLPPAVDR